MVVAGQDGDASSHVPFSAGSKRAVDVGDFYVLLSNASGLFAVVGVVNVARVPAVRDGRGSKFLRLAKPCLQGILLAAELVDEIACIAPQRVEVRVVGVAVGMAAATLFVGGGT